MVARILISDKLSPTAVQIFRDYGLEVDYLPDLGKDQARLFSIIGDYDGLAVRSTTQVTEDLLAAAHKLKLVGRAGIGVDNVDIPAASRRGIVVMNTPFGNSITTAEHAIALLFAVARQIDTASVSTRAGKWEKSKFMGVEISGKTLGIIGCGNIGAAVAMRALGLDMYVVAADPFLSEARAAELHIRKVDLEELFACSDFITLHTPLTEKTRHLISASSIAKMKDGVRIINCARGGLIIEEDLAAALHSGKVAAAGIDVFEQEPPLITNPLFSCDNAVCTPHLGASTMEAQENVARQIAGQMAEYFVRGSVSNAMNMPALTAEEAVGLKPFLVLAEMIGAFSGQLTEEDIQEIDIVFDGNIAKMNINALKNALLTGLLRPQVAEINMVSAPFIARERAILISETRRDKSSIFDGYIQLTIKTSQRTRSVAGTCFADGRPRLIKIKDIHLDARIGRHMLYITNSDEPGMIGTIGTICGQYGVNIATFALGRSERGHDAIALLALDEPVTEEALSALRAVAGIKQVCPLIFHLV